MPDPAHRSSTTPGALVSAALAFLLAFSWFVTQPQTVVAGEAEPNIVLILLDDMRWDYLDVMPQVRDEVLHQGIAFTNAFVENPMCCPSRTSILTGNASHTTGVFGNAPPHGGYQTFHDGGAQSSTLATWLHDAGYHTGLVGKYLNGYGPGNLAVPPGWDRWVALDEENGAYYDYDLNVDGTIEHRGTDETDYSTDVLGSEARHFILDAPKDAPLFLYFAPFGPHVPTRPAVRNLGTARRVPALSASVNEHNVRDKPRYVRRLRPADRHALKRMAKRTVETLASEDDAVRGLIHALEATERLQDTIIVFASDNGYLLGEHRIVGKQVPYDESIRIPLIIRDDALGAPHGDRTQLVVNTDLAPTLAELAGVATPPTDGSSLVPILLDPGGAGRRWFLFEHYHQAEGTGELTHLPSYCGIRTRQRSFVHYASGFEELYDVRVDRLEMVNVAGLQRERSSLRRLRGLARAACSPLPPDMSPF